MISCMYDKISKLSTQSIAKTNSGKIVTIISAELQQVERNMAIIPMALTSPLINLVVYIIIGYTASWEYSAIVFVTWAITMYVQNYAAKKSKNIMVSQSGLND